jgi:calcium/calmodulin-dependent protein kinase (CaM kinase) II
MPDSVPSSTSQQELLALNQKLLNSIVGGDWKTYADLCDPTLTCFEPEARGHVVEGMAFHKFYFDLGAGAPKPPIATVVTMASPHVRMLGPDAAILSYVRLNQKLNAAGEPVTAAVEETRVWQRTGGKWLHVHFHRSLPS